MRYILGIDTAGAEGSVALARDGKALFSESLPSGRHSGVLSGAVEEIFRRGGISSGELDGIGVSQGPGSFTGLRIGLAWAKGLALGRSLPLILVSAHEAAAHAHRTGRGRIATLVPGERGRVETALWERGAAARLLWGPEPFEEDSVIDQLLTRASEGSASPDGALDLAPSSAKLSKALEEQLEDRADRPGVSLIAPATLAPAIAEIADRLLGEGRTADWASASPSYGREPNARKPAT
jgi:tRNA threonylcarbamoyladenosine biosynthesis protein TsaB